jgi:hypothetical protein
MPVAPGGGGSGWSCPHNTRRDRDGRLLACGIAREVDCQGCQAHSKIGAGRGNEERGISERQAIRRTHGILRGGAHRERDRARRPRPYLVGLVALGLAAGPLLGMAGENAWVDARLDLLFGEHEPYRNFLRELQSAVREQARERLAAMVSYPLRTRIKGQRVRLHTPAEFLAHFDELLTPKTQHAIALQSYGDLFLNSQGVMIGQGEVWFGGVCKDQACSARSVKIIAVNP